MIIMAGGDEPAPELIEAVSYSSTNPYFRGKYFRRNLIQYRKAGGCFQEHPHKIEDIERRMARLRSKISALR